jgi:hypothetical protein
MRTALRMMTVGASALSIFAIIVCDYVLVSLLCGLSLFTLGMLWEMTK